MIYKKGDIVWVDFPFADSNQSKPRPALIISNNKINKTGDYLLMQITSKIKNDGLSLEIKNNNYRKSPLEIKSYLRLHKIFAINEALILSKKTSVTAIYFSQTVSRFIKLIK